MFHIALFTFGILAHYAALPDCKWFQFIPLPSEIGSVGRNVAEKLALCGGFPIACESLVALRVVILQADLEFNLAGSGFFVRCPGPDHPGIRLRTSWFGTCQSHCLKEFALLFLASIKDLDLNANVKDGLYSHLKTKCYLVHLSSNSLADVSIQV